MSPRSISSSSSASASASASSSSSASSSNANANANNDYSCFPKVIHITEDGLNNKFSSTTRTSRSPPRHILCTPPLKGLRRGGILKNSSYGRGVGGGGTVSTPTTVGTNESCFDSSSNSSSSSSSCNSSDRSDILNTSFTSMMSTNTEDINADAERIIRAAAAPSTPPRSSLNSEEHCSPLSPSASTYTTTTSSSSTSSTSSSSSESSSSSSKEEMQRWARIKHIEDLNERIKAAKTRKVVEKKVFRKENKLMLRLARQLKSTSKKNTDNAMELQELEETNQRFDQYYIQSKQELDHLKSSRILLEESLRADRERRLLQDQVRRDDILRDQTAQMELLKTNHQFRCQDLCESVLEANSELNRLRLLGQRISKDEDVIERGQQQETSRQQSRSVMLMLMLMATVVIVVLAIIGGRTTTTTTITTLIGEENGEWQIQPQQSIIASDDNYSIVIDDSVFPEPMMSNSCSSSIDSNEGDDDVDIETEIDVGTEMSTTAKTTKTKRKRFASVARLVDIYLHIE